VYDSARTHHQIYPLLLGVRRVASGVLTSHIGPRFGCLEREREAGRQAEGAGSEGESEKVM
jgi:hypothetical protein